MIKFLLVITLLVVPRSKGFKNSAGQRLTSRTDVIDISKERSLKIFYPRNALNFPIYLINQIHIY